MTERGVEFLLVTSRGTGRWIFPKGGRIAGLDDAGSAAQEAYEEAGVHGVIAPRPIGCYVDRPRRGRATEVRLYPLEVQLQHADWPEKHERRRRWVNLDDARRLDVAPKLLDLAEKTRAQLGADIAGAGRA